MSNSQTFSSLSGRAVQTTNYVCTLSQTPCTAELEMQNVTSQPATSLFITFHQCLQIIVVYSLEPNTVAHSPGNRMHIPTINQFLRKEVNISIPKFLSNDSVIYHRFPGNLAAACSSAQPSCNLNGSSYQRVGSAAVLRMVACQPPSLTFVEHLIRLSTGSVGGR